MDWCIRNNFPEIIHFSIAMFEFLTYYGIFSVFQIIFYRLVKWNFKSFRTSDHCHFLFVQSTKCRHKNRRQWNILFPIIQHSQIIQKHTDFLRRKISLFCTWKCRNPFPIQFLYKYVSNPFHTSCENDYIGISCRTQLSCLLIQNLLLCN